MEPILVTTVERDTANNPVLIIDKKGIVGTAVYEKIKDELMTALVSSRKPDATDNLIYIPYKHHIPEIPNGTYNIIIFISDDEKDLTDIIKKCLVKAYEDGIPFVFIVDYATAEEKLMGSILHSHEQAYVIVLGELFGQGESTLDGYMIQAGSTRSIKLPTMGLRKTHPVLFSDAIQGVLQTIFGIQKRQRLTYLYQQHAYTDLSLAHILQKMDPLLHIDFFRDTKKKEIELKDFSPLHGHYFFDKDYPIPEKLIAVYNDLSTLRKAPETFVYKEEEPILELDGGGFISESFKKWMWLFFYYVVIVLFVPLLGLGASAGVSWFALTAAKNGLAKGNMEQVKQEIAIAHGTFVFDQIIKTPMLFELHIVGMGSIADMLNSTITAGEMVTNALGNLFVAQDTLKAVLAGNSQDPQSDTLHVVTLLKSSLVSLQAITADPTQKSLIEKIGAYQKGMSLLTGTVGLLPDVLGVNGQRTYLVLFQNNNELRPGGGFIGSYGLISFNHGKMNPVSIHDVYDADGQLRQQVDPPFAIRRIMGIVHLYLRDSNFDPDFVVDAQKASQMLQLETGQHVDGVMAVDLTFVKYLLDATGPIYIPEQNVTVNAGNFFLLTEQHAEKNSFPGSRQKGNFLSAVFTALQNKLQANQGVQMSTLVQKSLEAITEKHLLFAMANLSSQNILTASALSSSLWDPRSEDNGTINDYMGINEANIGVNKVNYFMKRSIKQSVSIDGDGILNGEVAISYTNTSKPNEWPGGDYKNYIRLIVPQGTVLTGIAFDGEKQSIHSAITDPEIYEAKGFVPPNAVEIEQSQESGKTLYGFLATIPASSTKTVVITYQHAQKINLGSPVLHYSLSLYKQPGTNNDPYSFAFNYPLEYSLLSSSPANQDGNSDYTIDTPLSQDKTITVDLTKK